MFKCPVSKSMSDHCRAAISLLITAIYNIVDRIFVGNFNGTSALAVLSICFPLSYMMASGLLAAQAAPRCSAYLQEKANRKI